jgi:uncharacterized membrane protein
LTTGQSRGDIVSSEEQLIIRQYNGPIPPASELEQLKAVDPSFPDRVMRIAEAHAAADIRKKDRFSIAPIIGQIASLLISCFGFGVAVLFGLKGIEAGAITATIGGIAPIVIAALTNLKSKQKE